MTRFLLRRLLLIPIAILLANFAGFTYAHFALNLQMRRNPFFAPLERPAPLLPAYATYLQKAIRLDFGSLPIGAGLPIGDVVWDAITASLGLLAITFIISIIVGLVVGAASVRVDPPGVVGWLAPLSTVGLAMPSFYLGTLFIVGALAYAIQNGPDAPSIPTSGFGWDLHLLFPVLALMLRPTVQIAQLTASLLAGELGKRYVVTARSVGNTWRTIRWKHVVRNAVAPIVLNMAGAFRLLVGELIVVEWLFAWPGIGRLLAWILIPTSGSHEAESLYFLHPSALAAALTVFALFFLVADLLASALVRSADPRLRAMDGDAA